MKRIKKITSMLMITAMLAAICLAGCGGGKTPDTTTAATENGETAAPTESQTKTLETEAPETTAEPETEAAVSTQTYSITDEEDGVAMTVEIPEIDGIEVKELSSRSGLRIVYDAGGWKLDLVVDTSNAQSLAKKISDGESLSYGDNIGYVEFDSWAAKGAFDFGEYPANDALTVVISYDLRPADTYQPDDEDELRGYLEDEYVDMIFAAMQADVV